MELKRAVLQPVRKKNISVGGSQFLLFFTIYSLWGHFKKKSKEKNIYFNKINNFYHVSMKWTAKLQKVKNKEWRYDNNLVLLKKIGSL